jgi:hypothetical protein
MKISEEPCGPAACPGVITRRTISMNSPGQQCETPGTPAADRDPAACRWPAPEDAINLYLHAEALRRAFPAWFIAVQPWPGDRARIEAVNPHGGDLCALISTDPAEVWHELSASHAP